MPVYISNYVFFFFPINRRCSSCKKKRSLRTNSFFEELPRVPLGTLLLAIHHFVYEDSQRQTARRLNLNPGLVSKIYRRLQDVCSRDLDERPFIPFGGSGAAVKCDESKFNHKAKFNRGRRAARDAWVFGIVTTDFSPARGYFQVVERRDIATLDPIISKCIRPETEVYTDDWASYRGMEHRINNVAAHRIVVHARHFVDPVTGVHTQEVESCWNNLKLGQKIRRGMKKEDLQSYLDEQMWRQWRGGPHRQIMQNFLEILPLQYAITDAAL